MTPTKSNLEEKSNDKFVKEMKGPDNTGRRTPQHTEKAWGIEALNVGCANEIQQSRKHWKNHLNWC